MKVICIDARMAFHSGIGTYIRNIVPKLPFKLILIAHEALFGLETIVTSVPIYSLEEQIKIPLLIPKCDVFWAPHYNIPLAPIRAKKRLTTIHDVCHLVFPQKWHKKLYAKTMLSRATRLSDHVLTNSAFSKKEIIHTTGIKEEKITAIHLGVNQSVFFSRDEPKEKYFLYVGNRLPHKNLDRLHLAWDKIVQNFPDWTLKIVGGNLSQQELSLFYAKAHALIHPSLYEGFGLTVLEAMSSGCPVLTSHVASLTEVCQSSVLYFDPYDIDSIANAARKIIEDKELHDDLRKKGLERIQEFSWEKAVEEHIEILEKL